MGNGPLEQPLVYQVYYNGSVENVTSPTTALTFTAPSLPDGVFVDNVTVTVTAINRFGPGSPSDPDSAEISELSVYVYHNTYVGIHMYLQYIGRADANLWEISKT